jgi:capsular exopolysaccharide synthesis family protein
MEIRRFLGTLYRRAPAIVVVAAVTMLVVTAAGIMIPPVYRAEAKVRVLWDVGVYDLSPRDYVAERLVTTYTEVLTSEPLVAEAIRRTSPELSSLTTEDLAIDLDAEAVPDSDLLSISVQTSDPALARDLANTMAVLLIEFAQHSFVGMENSAEQLLDKQAAAFQDEIFEGYQLMATAEALDEESAEARGLRRQILQKEETYRRMLERAELVRSYESLRANSVEVISPASMPLEPMNRIGRREIGLGLVIGLCAGIGLALLLENMDSRIKSLQQVEVLTGLPVLGSVPRALSLQGNPANGFDESSSQLMGEAYDRLSISLEALMDQGSHQTILITSAAPPGDYSEVPANLAPVVAQSGRTVLLMDTDLWQPTLHQPLQVSNRLGLSALLEGQASLDEAIQTTSASGVSVLTSGPLPSNPARLLRSPKMAALLENLAERFDVILLNTPSPLAEPGSAALARQVDGIILLLDHSLTTEEQVCAALQELRAAGGRPLGLVFLQKGIKKKRAT